MSDPLVKICGLTRHEDARAAARAGARYLGVVLVSRSPRGVTAADARRIRGDLPASLVLVSADRPVERLSRDAEVAGADVLQLHGDEDPDTVRALREAGGWTIWKSVRVREPADVARALDRYGDLVDGLHLDGWHPERLGGTGRRFPWEKVRAPRNAVPEEMTIVAAGGLTPENVARAVEVLRPHVVDVSSGVEARAESGDAPRAGIKDPRRIRAFVEAARSSAGAGARDR